MGSPPEPELEREAVRGRWAYVSGPIDAAKVYREWATNAASDYFGTIYLKQFYTLLAELDADGLIITTRRGQVRREQLDRVTVVNVPLPNDRTGIGFHLAMAAWALRCCYEIVRFRADIALLTAGQDYFWLFRALRLWRVKLVASLHCTLWPKFAPKTPHKRLLDWLNGRFFYPVCDHIQGVSEEAVEQVRASSPSLRAEPQRFVATYDRARFAHIPPPEWPSPDKQFRLLYVGRLAVNKGVLDLVRIMARLEESQPGRFALDICGQGGAAQKLDDAIREARLEHVIRVNGQCATDALARKYVECHAVVVPTRSDFEEGTPKVAFEAVLNLRPVVMSAVCPALADVRAATIEPRVDDVEDYVRAIRELSDDPELYRAKSAAADPCRQKHFDDRNSYGFVLGGALRKIADPPESRRPAAVARQPG